MKFFPRSPRRSNKSRRSSISASNAFLALAAPIFLLLPSTEEKSAFPTKESLMRHVEELTSKEYEGRGAGTKGGRKAAEYIVKQFRTAGLRAFDGEDYLQAFTHNGLSLNNVVGYIAGADPQLKEEFVVLGAHFDHMGINKKDEMYPGADDNASGCAVLIEVARALSQPAAVKRSLMFIAFDGEEKGLLGSRWWIANSAVPKEKIVAMINLDMVCRMETEAVHVCGTPYSTELKSIVETQASEAKLELKYDKEREWLKSSDHYPFFKAGIPFLYFGVVEHEDYHRPTDTADKCNQEKLRRIALLTYLTMRETGNAALRPVFLKPEPADKIKTQ